MKRDWDIGETRDEASEPGRKLEGIKHVAGQQSEYRHDQDCFQLFVVRVGAAKVIAGGLLRVKLDGQVFTYGVRRYVLRSVMAKVSVIYVITRPIRELNVVVARDAAEVIVKPYPFTRVHGCVCGGPRPGRRQLPKKTSHI
jgi:hypothetical protein